MISKSYESTDFDSSDSSQEQIGGGLFSGNESRIFDFKTQNKEIDRSLYKQYPYNVAGIIQGSCPQYQSFGNGFLISSSFVITSAHLLFVPTKEEKVIRATNVQFYSKHKGFESQFKVKAKEFKIHPKFEEIQNERMRLRIQKRKVKMRKNLSENEKSSIRKDLRKQMYSLLKESEKYDVALIRLSTEIILPKYPILNELKYYQTFNIYACGFRQIKQNLKTLHIISPQTTIIQINQTAGVYDIDSQIGFSGTAIFMDQNKSAIIGIHKGYDKRSKNKICTLINQEILLQLKQWILSFYMFQSNNYTLNVTSSKINRKINFNLNTTVAILLKQVSTKTKQLQENVLLYYRGKQINTKREIKLIDIGIKDNDTVELKIELMEKIIITRGGKSITMRFNKNTTVQDVVNEISKRQKISIQKIGLFYAGMELDSFPKKKLYDFGIEEFSTIFLYFR